MPMANVGYASELEFESETTMLKTVGPVSVTVPVAVPPLSTDDGEMERAESSASAKTSDVCWFIPLRVAVIVTVVLVTPAVVLT